MDTQSNNIIKVPMGNSKEDIKAREAIISNVYRLWYESNPSKAVYNSHLKDYINVRFLSVGVKKKSGMKIQYCITAIET